MVAMAGPGFDLAAALADGGLAESEAVALLWAVAPVALGGVAARARAGPARDAWLTLARQAWLAGRAGQDGPWQRLPPGITEDRLLGALDVAATLAQGRSAVQPGLLDPMAGGVLVAPMAERLSPLTAAHLSQRLDGSPDVGFALLALDEGEDVDGVNGTAGDASERLADRITDRLAFVLRLDAEAMARRQAGEAMRMAGTDVAATTALPAAAVRFATTSCPQALRVELVAACEALGVAGLRAATFVVQAARAAAALAGRDEVGRDDAGVAIRLVLLPRATRLPPPAEAAEPEAVDPSESAEPPPPPQEAQDREQDAPDVPPPEPAPEPPPELSPEIAERLVAAALARLPPDLLASLQSRLAAASRQAQTGGRHGAALRQGERGPTVGVRRGDPRQGGRLALLETLRAAAPWQTWRRRQALERAAARQDGSAIPRVLLHRDDFRLRRHKPRSATVTLFAIDASGSAAMHRMAEAKGAVELLLADCYARRDQVGVIAFGGRLGGAGGDAGASPGVQTLLPPTRSLVRARRSLESLPGGGGTPLAAGLAEAGRQADLARRTGASPLLVVLTDGRANLGLRAEPLARAEALALALTAARQLAASGLPALLIDISPQPSPQARQLADALKARYLALPNAAAAALPMAQAVRALRPGAAA